MNAAINLNNGTPAPSGSPSSSPQTDQREQQIKVYYGNEDGSALTENTAVLCYSTLSSNYLAALNTLKQSQDPKSVSLCPNFTFKTADMKDGNLTIDLSFKADDQLGANGEQLLMQEISKTLFQYGEVKTIDLLLTARNWYSKFESPYNLDSSVPRASYCVGPEYRCPG